MYHVSYTEECTPKLKTFSSKAEATKFIANFMLKYQFVNIDDNCVNMVFTGDLVYLDPSTPHSGKIDLSDEEE